MANDYRIDCISYKAGMCLHQAAPRSMFGCAKCVEIYTPYKNCTDPRLPDMWCKLKLPVVRNVLPPPKISGGRSSHEKHRRSAVLRMYLIMARLGFEVRRERDFDELGIHKIQLGYVHRLVELKMHLKYAEVAAGDLEIVKTELSLWGVRMDDGDGTPLTLFDRVCLHISQVQDEDWSAE